MRDFTARHLHDTINELTAKAQTATRSAREALAAGDDEKCDHYSQVVADNTHRIADLLGKYTRGTLTANDLNQARTIRRRAETNDELDSLADAN